MTSTNYLAYDAFSGEYLGRVARDVYTRFGDGVGINLALGGYAIRLRACCYLSSGPSPRIVNGAFVAA